MRPCLYICVCVCINEHNSSIQRSKYMHTYIIHKLGTCADSDIWHKLCELCVRAWRVSLHASLMQTYLTKRARHTTSKRKKHTNRAMYVYAHMYLLYELNYRYINPHYECACVHVCMYVCVFVCVVCACVRECMCMYVCVRMRLCVEIIITAVHNVQEYMHTHTHKATHVHIDSATYRGYQEQRPLCVCVYVSACVRVCVCV